MKLKTTYPLLVFFMFRFFSALPGNTPGPVAKFSFNNKKDRDEISNQKAKLVGVVHTDDRFGNEKSAVYLFGNEGSYINLGSYKALKPAAGSISLWAKIEGIVYHGRGARINPILLTKCADRDDFYESYAFYYAFDTKRISTGCSLDSTKQSSVYAMGNSELLTWHHLVVTYDDRYLCFYVDGKSEGKLPKNFHTEFNPLDSVVVGTCANQKNMRFTNGVVDDIEFYDRVLSSAEVTALYNAPNPNKNKIVWNWILLSLLIILILWLIYQLVKYRLSITLKKEKERLELANKLLENELRINRALMNPHFIFNSLNTLHNYILKNNSDAASDYLIRFSKLIRRILDTNMSDTISLELEIELIDGYIGIEGRRFKEDIKHTVIVEPGITPASVIIPIMMLQPFIENSVWHGLREKQGNKSIAITFSLYEEQYVKCTIDDNGTGLKIKNAGAVEKQSLSTGFIRQRLGLLNKIHNLQASLNIAYKPNGQGTLVTILLPILNK